MCNGMDTLWNTCGRRTLRNTACRNRVRASGDPCHLHGTRDADTLEGIAGPDVDPALLDGAEPRRPARTTTRRSARVGARRRLTAAPRRRRAAAEPDDEAAEWLLELGL